MLKVKFREMIVNNLTKRRLGPLAIKLVQNSKKWIRFQYKFDCRKQNIENNETRVIIKWKLFFFSSF
jgi:hypothetical protein